MTSEEKILPTALDSLITAVTEKTENANIYEVNYKCLYLNYEIKYCL